MNARQIQCIFACRSRPHDDQPRFVGKGGVLAFFAFARRLNFNCFKWHLLSIEKGVEKLQSNGNHQSEDSSRHRVEIEIGSKGKRRRKEKQGNGKRREQEEEGKEERGGQ